MLLKVSILAIEIKLKEQKIGLNTLEVEPNNLEL